MNECPLLPSADILTLPGRRVVQTTAPTRGAPMKDIQRQSIFHYRRKDHKANKMPQKRMSRLGWVRYIGLVNNNRHEAVRIEWVCWISTTSLNSAFLIFALGDREFHLVIICQLEILASSLYSDRTACCPTRTTARVFRLR